MSMVQKFFRWNSPISHLNYISLRILSIYGNQTKHLKKLKQKQMTAASSSAPSPSKKTQDEFVEDVVCKASDLVENEMKVFDLVDGKVLLIKQNGKINALGTKCTHYGAPLEKSAIGEGRIRCQWHGACFNITTGDIEDFPGLDSLPCYQVTIEDEKVRVRAKKSELMSNKRIKQMAKRDPQESQNIVVVGGGPTGAVCVETLRQEGFQGKITFVTKEKYLPYDRIKLSKDLSLDIGKIQLRANDFYKDNDIEFLSDSQVIAVDTKSKTVKLNNNTTLNYDRLFLATGSKPRIPDIPGVNLRNVVVLREYEDAKNISSLISPEKEVIILGSSFIGMECAAHLTGKVKSVTVIGKDTVPFQGPFGNKVGTALMNLFTEKGVTFRMQTNIKKFNGNSDGALTDVELVDGTSLKADICIVGIGSTYNTEFLQSSGITLNANGTVEVDEYLTTNIPNVFAGGDIANAPIYTSNNAKASIGHWGLAHYHGRIAALNMLGKVAPVKNIPYFWTMLFGKSIRYAGFGKYDDILYVGNVDELKFVAFYLKNDEVIAVSSCMMDPIVSQFAEYSVQGKKLTRQQLETDPLKWTK